MQTCHITSQWPATKETLGRPTLKAEGQSTTYKFGRHVQLYRHIFDPYTAWQNTCRSGSLGFLTDIDTNPYVGCENCLMGVAHLCATPIRQGKADKLHRSNGPRPFGNDSEHGRPVILSRPRSDIGENHLRLE